jgi:hypothetical protein
MLTPFTSTCAPGGVLVTVTGDHLSVGATKETYACGEQKGRVAKVVEIG